MTVPAPRSLVLVVGVGRSGTSLLAGILGQLGFHIPRPEVKANATNPRGFGEPRWVVDFHTRLLRSQRITVNDARPDAWQPAARAGEDPVVHDALRDWLSGQLREADAIVVKDPRTVWFLPLWMRCAEELGVSPAFVTMLRHPAETVTSARSSYGTWQTEASRAAAWLNMTLETERATRGARRAFVRHEDLLGDWAAQIARLGTLLDLPLLRDVDGARFAKVDRFVDPTLHRHRVGWQDVDVPAGLRELAEDVWRAVEPLAAPGGDNPDARAALDAARDAFTRLYKEAEDTAQSSLVAARRRGGRGAAGKGSGGAPASLRVRLARRVPVRLRRRLRHALSVVRAPRGAARSRGRALRGP
jgi:hypothetical protein